MKSINRETVIALVLLAFTGAMWIATYDIPDPGYQTIGSDVWPRIILTGLAAMNLIYLVIALRGRRDASRNSQSAPATGAHGVGWYRRYRNPLWCFLLFFLFLVSMPYLGMLVGGVLFVFLALTVLGRNTAKDVAVHAAVAVGTVGAMWAVFTFGLRVILPEGELFGPL